HRDRAHFLGFAGLVADRRYCPAAAARRAARVAEATAAQAAIAARRAGARRHAVGTRLQRGMGRRDREAARTAVRASAIEALAEDEMRGVAGAGRRRLYRSARRTRWTRCAARRLL